MIKRRAALSRFASDARLEADKKRKQATRSVADQFFKR